MPELIWYVAGVLTVPALVALGLLLGRAGCNVPKLEDTPHYCIYSFGFGQMVRFKDRETASRIYQFGWKVHALDGRPWALKILRWSI